MSTIAEAVIKNKKADVAPAEDAKISSGPLSASKKIYVKGTRYPQIRVPMREIALSPTIIHAPDGEKRTPNAPITVYDTSGPYTDLDVAIDIRRGLKTVRSELIGAGAGGTQGLSYSIATSTSCARLRMSGD